MPERFLIIDGYNLLHAAGMARYRYGPGELEKARNRLLNFLVSRLNASERARTTIVFDAADAPYESTRRSGLEGMTVLFAKRGGDADTVIERLVEIHSAPRQIHLISSDHRLQKAARKRRARPVDSDVFFAELESRDARSNIGGEPAPPRQLNNPKFTGDVPESETEELMRIFSGAETNIPDELSKSPEAAETTEAQPNSESGTDEADDEEKVTDIADSAWLKYLAEFPENLGDLLDEAENWPPKKKRPEK